MLIMLFTALLAVTTTESAVLAAPSTEPVPLAVPATESVPLAASEAESVPLAAPEGESVLVAASGAESVSSAVPAAESALWAAPTAEPLLRFDDTQYDSPGKDDRSAASLNAEWIRLINTGKAPVRLKGWSVEESQGRVYTFGNVVIPANRKITLHTGPGADTATDLYWNSGNYIWNNTGDQATLRDPAGRVHDLCGWGYLNGRTHVPC
ncbi:lamin tail domain-containing protein [Actinoplanes sp. G11-F43]|uniref:lamin tail domain-containing protein n=1 Tax=Actinoplanes sp. G11-F43 TaxID=3424130 RepID=UPI003D32E1F3